MVECCMGHLMTNFHFSGIKPIHVRYLPIFVYHFLKYIFYLENLKVLYTFVKFAKSHSCFSPLCFISTKTSLTYVFLCKNDKTIWPIYFERFDRQDRTRQNSILSQLLQNIHIILQLHII